MKTWNRTPWQRFGRFVVGAVLSAVLCRLLNSEIQNLIYSFLVSGMVFGLSLVWARGYNKGILRAILLVLGSSINFTLAYLLVKYGPDEMMFAVIILAIPPVAIGEMSKTLLGIGSPSPLALWTGGFTGIGIAVIICLVNYYDEPQFFYGGNGLSIFFLCWQIGVGAMFSKETAQDKERKALMTDGLIDQIGKDKT